MLRVNATSQLLSDKEHGAGKLKRELFPLRPTALRHISKKIDITSKSATESCGSGPAQEPVQEIFKEQGLLSVDQAQPNTGGLHCQRCPASRDLGKSDIMPGKQ